MIFCNWASWSERPVFFIRNKDDFSFKPSFQRLDAEIRRALLTNKSINDVCPQSYLISYAFSFLIFVFSFLLSSSYIPNVRENTAQSTPSRYVSLELFSVSLKSVGCWSLIWRKSKQFRLPRGAWVLVEPFLTSKLSLFSLWMNIALIDLFSVFKKCAPRSDFRAIIPRGDIGPVTETKRDFAWDSSDEKIKKGRKRKPKRKYGNAFEADRAEYY